MLITGAAGLVGGQLREHWGDRHRLRLADIRPVGELAAHEEYRQLDITDVDDFAAACDGFDVVVHLAADASPGAEFYDTLLPLNIIGAYNAFEAARRAGCRRLVVASSVHAVQGYRRHTSIEWDAPVYPESVYGATKCWAEVLARVYWTQHRLSVICARICSVRFDQGGDWDPDQPEDNLSPRDCAQLFLRCVEAEGVEWAIVHGTSRHRNAWMSLDHTTDLVGYQPQDGTAFPKTATGGPQR